MRSLFIAVMLSTSVAFAQDVTLELPAVTAATDFVDPLTPYGTWVSVGGVQAFRPAVTVVGGDFVPYSSRGHWVNTDAGWVFESDLPFAWATYHYGRWYLDPGLGWVWVPDVQWGPAWVDWRFGGGYAGWAPLPPPRFARAWQPRWVFVETPYFGVTSWHAHVLPPPRVHAALAVAVTVPPRPWRGERWHMGPSYAEVARVAPTPPARAPAAQFVPPPSFRNGRGPSPVPLPPRRDVPPPQKSLAPPPPGRSNARPESSLVPPPPGRMNAGPQQSLAPPPPGRSNARPESSPVPPPPGRMSPAPQRSFAPPPPGRINARPESSPVPPPPGRVSPAPQRSFAPPPPGRMNPAPQRSFAPPPQRMNAPPTPGRSGGRVPPPPPHR